MHYFTYFIFLKRAAVLLGASTQRDSAVLLPTFPVPHCDVDVPREAQDRVRVRCVDRSLISRCLVGSTTADGGGRRGFSQQVQGLFHLPGGFHVEVAVDAQQADRTHPCES